MTRDEILDTAKELINGQRAKDYGDAEENFQRIADGWTRRGILVLAALLRNWK